MLLSMKYLGIDYGSKRVGLATSDEGGSFAFPRETIQFDPNALGEIKDLVQELRIEAIVIGIPETASGVMNTVEDDIRIFAEKLEVETGLPVFFQNEQFTSIEASRYAPGEKKDDAVSAALILQRYLDAHPEGK